MVGSGDSCWGRAARMGLSKQPLTSGASHSRAVVRHSRLAVDIRAVK